MTVVRQALLLARRDWRVEVRAGEVLLVTLPFGATALLVIALAVGANVTMLRSIAPGVFWAVVLLFGALVTVRASGVEPSAHRDALTLLGVDPAARVIARAGVGAVLLVLVQVALAPVSVVLYDADLSAWVWLVALVPLAAIGLGGLGAIVAALTVRTTGRATLGPLLLVPLALPIVVAGTQVMEGTTYGTSPLPWLALLGAADLAIVAGAVAAAPWLEEDDR